jgi:hypothetical protein
MDVEEGLVKVLGIFTIVGIGFGAAGAMVVASADSGSFGDIAAGFVSLQSIIFLFLASPMVAAVAGLYSMYSFESSTDAIQASGAGSFVGFYLMFLGAFIMLSITGFGPSPSFISENILKIGLSSLPSAAVGSFIPLLD